MALNEKARQGYPAGLFRFIHANASGPRYPTVFALVVVVDPVTGMRANAAFGAMPASNAS